MKSHHTHTLSLSIGGDVPTWEGEATVDYTVEWGAPERGPAYDLGGLPADPDEIDDVRVTHIDGARVVQGYPSGVLATPLAATLEDLISESDILLGELLSAAADESA